MAGEKILAHDALKTTTSAAGAQTRGLFLSQKPIADGEPGTRRKARYSKEECLGMLKAKALEKGSFPTKLDFPKPVQDDIDHWGGIKEFKREIASDPKFAEEAKQRSLSLEALLERHIRTTGKKPESFDRNTEELVAYLKTWILENRRRPPEEEIPNWVRGRAESRGGYRSVVNSILLDPGFQLRLGEAGLDAKELLMDKRRGVQRREHLDFEGCRKLVLEKTLALGFSPTRRFFSGEEWRDIERAGRIDSIRTSVRGAMDFEERARAEGRDPEALLKKAPAPKFGHPKDYEKHTGELESFIADWMLSHNRRLRQEDAPEWVKNRAFRRNGFRTAVDRVVESESFRERAREEGVPLNDKEMAKALARFVYDKNRLPAAGEMEPVYDPPPRKGLWPERILSLCLEELLLLRFARDGRFPRRHEIPESLHMILRSEGHLEGLKGRVRDKIKMLEEKHRELFIHPLILHAAEGEEPKDPAVVNSKYREIIGMRVRMLGEFLNFLETERKEARVRMGDVGGTQGDYEFFARQVTEPRGLDLELMALAEHETGDEREPGEGHEVPERRGKGLGHSGGEATEPEPSGWDLLIADEHKQDDGYEALVRRIRGRRRPNEDNE